MKTYPLTETKSLFPNEKDTFQSLGIKINPLLEGIEVTEKILAEKNNVGSKKLISLEFNWLPAEVVAAYNSAQTAIEKKQILVGKVYGNCQLNCKGCYVKQDNLFENHDLVYPEKILDLIAEAVKKLGTKTVKYLGPSEFFRDKDAFKHLDRFERMGVILGIFIKDPMFGDDAEVKRIFGDQGLDTSEKLIERIATYKNVRLLFNFRSFDEEITNDLVRGGYTGKTDYQGNYKLVQSRALQLLYKHFAKAEIEQGRESRLVIINTPITKETIDEAFEIFTYFVDRGVLVVSTTSMQSGCGGGIYGGLDEEFIKKFRSYYAKVIKYSLHRGLISGDYLQRFGPSPYAGISHCIQLCHGLLIRETGQLMRCPGADHAEWRDAITPSELLSHGLTWAWEKTKNYREASKINVGCLAKPKIFTPEFNYEVIMEIIKSK